MINIKQQLNTPLLFIRQHGLNQLIGLVNNAVVAWFYKAQLLRFNQGLHDLDCIFVQVRVVDHVELADYLNQRFQGFVLNRLTWSHLS